MRKFFVVLSILFLLGTTFTRIAEASSYKTPKVPDDAIKEEAKEGFTLDTKDLSFEGIMQYLQDQRSFIFVRKDADGNKTYFLNTPNVPLNAANMFQSLNKGGWLGTFSTRDVEEGQTDALKQYGYDNPSYVYVGERPITFLSVDQIAASYINILSGLTVLISIPIGGLCSLFGNNDFNLVVGQINPDEVGNVVSENDDYEDANKEYLQQIGAWLERAWDKIPTERLAEIKVGEAGLDTLTDGKTVGGDMSGEDLLGAIIDKAGNNYATVIAALLEYANSEEGSQYLKDTNPPQSLQLRIMPYDIYQMSDASKQYMGGVSDPRVEMFGSTYLLGFVNVFFKQIANFFTNALLGLTGFLCWLAGTLNAICDLGLLQQNGVDPTMVWTGAVGSFLCIALLIISVFMIVKFALSVLTGKESLTKALARSFGAVLMAGFVLAILIAPQAASTFISDTATRVMSIGSSAMQSDDTFSQYYVQGQSSQSEISELRYWFAYHNCWAQYATGHALREEAQDFNSNPSQNEYATLQDGTYESPAILSEGKKINTWAAQLLDSLERNSTNEALRAVDHFMAPTVTDTSDPNQADDVSFTVSRNQYFDGTYMYQNFPWGGIGIALVLLALTVLKVMCFIGFLVDFMLMLIKAAAGALGGKKYLKDNLMTMLSEVIKVMVYDLVISEVIYASGGVSGLGYDLLAVLLCAATIAYFRYLWNHPTFIGAPAIWSTIRKAGAKAKNRIAMGAAGFAGENGEGAEYREKKKQLKEDIKSRKNEKKGKGRRVATA